MLIATQEHTAGDSVDVRVEARDQHDNIAVFEQRPVLASSAAFSSVLVDVQDGVGILTVHTKRTETVAIVLTDTADTKLELPQAAFELIFLPGTDR